MLSPPDLLPRIVPTTPVPPTPSVTSISAPRSAAATLQKTVDRAFAEGQLRSYDIGGSDGTEAIASTIARLVLEEAVP